MANGKGIPINLTKFEGDPDILEFFFDQLRSIAKINKYSNEATIAIFKNNITGPALKFLTQNPEISKSDDLDLIENEFKRFFAPASQTQALVEFDNLLLLPAESIKNLAHRLNVLAAKVYPQLDKPSVNYIKFTKFVRAIPQSIRIKILEESIQDYDQAVLRAQTLQDIINNEKILNTYAMPTTDTIFEDRLKEITEKINLLSHKTKETEPIQSTSTQDNVQRPYKNFGNYRQNKNFRSQNFKRYSPHKRQFKRQVTCQLCFRKNHEAKACFKWKRLNTQRRDEQTSTNQSEKDQENYQ